MGKQTLMLSLLGAGALLVACDASYQVGEVNQIGQSVKCASDGDCSGGKRCETSSGACITPAATKNLDVLFMIDNSTSMSPFQTALAQSIPMFIKHIEATSANYHIGVITSDVGTLPPPGTPFPGVMDQRCGTLNGDDGRLQNIPCKSRTLNVSPDFTSSCTTLCPAPVVPTQPWIARDHGTYNVSDPVAAFKCMALVGDGGCGVEGQLESVKRALDGHLAENSGFLRDDSLLAIIFITDEDDCSIKLSSRNLANPTAKVCSPAGDKDDPSCFNLDYRCMAKNVDCDQPMDIPGLKTNCKEKSASWLQDVTSYVSFLKGLRISNRLFVTGIWSLPSIESGGTLSISSEVPGISDTNALNRVRQSCAAKSGPSNLSTAPQLRLSKFAQGFAARQQIDLCLVDSYTTALDQMATAMLQAAGLE